MIIMYQNSPERFSMFLFDSFASQALFTVLICVIFTWTRVLEDRHSRTPNIAARRRVLRWLGDHQRCEEQHVKLTEGCEGRLWECCICFSHPSTLSPLPLILLEFALRTTGTSFLGGHQIESDWWSAWRILRRRKQV